MFPRYFSGEITNWPRLLCYSLRNLVFSPTTTSTSRAWSPGWRVRAPADSPEGDMRKNPAHEKVRAGERRSDGSGGRMACTADRIRLYSPITFITLYIF